MPSIIGILSKLFHPINLVLDRVIPDKNLASHVEKELQRELMTNVAELLEKELQAQLAIMQAETNPEGLWIQRAWRPLTMLIFAGTLAINYLVPPLVGKTPAPLPPEFMTFLEIGMGGYIVGRSAEKIAETWKK